MHDVGEWGHKANAGTTILAGHVNWVGQGPGALGDLADIAPGATVYLANRRGRRERVERRKSALGLEEGSARGTVRERRSPPTGAGYLRRRLRRGDPPVRRQRSRYRRARANARNEDRNPHPCGGATSRERGAGLFSPLACATLSEPFARSGGATVKKVLLLAAPLALFVAALLGLVILFSTVGGTAQATACTLSALSTTKTTATTTSATTTTTTPSSNANCGAAAPATLPTSPVVNNGLPTNYVIPADATAAETVAITYALAQLGKPYLWGGAGPAAFDCSGLTMMAWAQAGVTLLHYTGDQINEGTAVALVRGDSTRRPGPRARQRRNSREPRPRRDLPRRRAGRVRGRRAATA